MLCRLVAHHSCAVIEAEERGLAAVLRREFDLPPQSLADALTCCDMTTSPDGEHVHVDRRLAEIHDRYGSRSPGQPVDPPGDADDPPGGRPGLPVPRGGRRVLLRAVRHERLTLAVSVV